MADSKRELVLQHLEELLAKILTGNDYQTNMGTSVRRGIRGSIEEADAPALVIKEGVETISTLNLEKNDCYLPVELTGYVAFSDSDINNWSVLGNMMLADIIKCIGSDTTINSTAIDTEPGDRFIDEPEPDSSVLRVEANFTIHYRTGYLDPYN